MRFTDEYNRLTNRLINKIPLRVYKPVGEVGFEGFVTRDRLSYQEAENTPKVSMPAGMEWGEKWEYGWFFTDIVIPESCAGERVMFTAKLGECIVFVNGRIFGALDKEHTHVTLTENAKPGEKFRIVMEVYAGHSNGVEFNQEENYNVLIPELNLHEFPESGITQKKVSNGSFGIFYEEPYALWVDIMVLYDLIKYLDDNSLRKANIEKALQDVCHLIDMEASFDEFLKQVAKAREILRPAMECKNGSSAPVQYAIGNSHLDLEWLWPVDETRRKAARTIGNQLKVIEEFPEYKYIQSQPWLLESIKKDYPELYEEVKVAVEKGNIIPEGGTWVQMDTNIPSGENLVRQFVVGKKFIKDEFGLDSKLTWLPDSFGSSGALPQIMKGCGIDYFFSAKLKWQYNQGDPFPKATFKWQGIDGTEILAHITEGYANECKPTDVFFKWERNTDKAEVPAIIFPYGWGDGGGGATKENLEYLKRYKDLEGIPKLVHANPVDFFKYAEEECNVESKMVGELYYSEHRGTYTTQAKTKRYNRKSEVALRDAEMWSAFLGNNQKEETDLLWKDVLFNDFHDILPGTSIKRVHDRAEESYKNVINKAEDITKSSIKGVLNEATDVLTVFNSLSWDRKTIVELPEGYTSVEGCETQKINDKIVALIEVPSCGCKSFKLGKDVAADTDKGDFVLENNLIRAEFNENGELISLINKKNGIETLNGPSNVFRMYRDMPSWWDPTDIEKHHEFAEIDIDTKGEVIPEYKGELISSLIIKRKICNSEISQRVILRKDSQRLDFETTVDWKEDHKLLKVEFNTNINTEDLVSEIQFGHVKRPTHRNRAYDIDRFEVSQHKWSALSEARRGVAILNDCKYGISALGGSMRLTLLKSSATPIINSEYGEQLFTYSVMPYTGSFDDSGVIREAYELNCPVTAYVGGTEERSMISLSEDNVIVEAVKLAEDGSGDIIVRLYESLNSATSVNINFGIDVDKIYLTNMLEENIEEISVSDNKTNLVMRGFEIVTLRIKTK